MGKIPKEIIPVAYNIAKQVYEKTLPPGEGKRSLVDNNKLNSSSAALYIWVFNKLMNGQFFPRTLNMSSMDFFLENISKDYGSSKLSNALLALEKHIIYNEKLRNCRMRSMNDLFKKYAEMI